ncbi:branched-chain amino acid ABC transporter ATP-binding protein/permease [Pseudomonas versuta]|uniref:Branched-chain amino acid ABC transporter ATP-binding protein n=1 Tax=Pseudomonas versuta TaxID=1788301 RepID=A0ABX3E3I4_9PSED|nr:branched-chain amino acid ABC transporter ATP-binding protein/permease [Pseudomonas versuta]ALE88092.1 branched-chain amino acid ABC transporter ATP-binding protein [Pseudomonas versuta]OKA17588.1 branched-chain amino acid ABC transporter ATP-binding protein [Pseudomonas versuta]
MNILHPRVYMSFLLLALLLIIPISAGSPFVYHLFILICSYAALASAWNIVGGFAGQLSLGHAVFYGVGAYTTTLLMINFGLSPWIGMFAGAILSALVAIVISWPCFRLRGPFFALATIAVLEVVRLVAINQHDVTGGAAGLGVPLKLGFEWMLFRPRWPYLLIAFGFLVITLAVSWKIKTSRLGYYLIAVREREDAAHAVGVNSVKVKLIAVVLSAFLTSLIGSFHAMYLTFIEPGSMFSLDLSIQIAMFALIGGLGTVSGPLIGTLLVLPLAELARGWLGDMGSGVHGLVYGIVLVVVVLTIPQGLVGRFGARVFGWIDSLPGGKTPQRRPAPLATVSPTPQRPVTKGEPILVAKHLHKFFGGLHATNDVSLSLAEGEIVGVIGPNGAGKTTVFNQLSGFLLPSEGRVRVRLPDGEWVTPASPAEFARAGIGRTFQIVQPFADLSVSENIMLGAFMHTADTDEARAIASQVAQLTDLAALLDTRARNLTVGGMKRLEMARALATRPRILLLDEVMAGLNPTDVVKAIEVIRRVRDSGVSVLMIEHLMQATMSLSDRIIVISSGSMLTQGAPQDVINDPRVIEAYLGKEYSHA